MLSREIGVSSNLVSYVKGKPARFLETVILCEAFRGNFQKKPAPVFVIIIRYQCILVFVSVSLCCYLFSCISRLWRCLSYGRILLLLIGKGLSSKGMSYKCRHKNKYALISYDSKDQSRFLLKVSTKCFTQNYCFQESGWLPLPIAHQITGHTNFP